MQSEKPRSKELQQAIDALTIDARVMRERVRRGETLPAMSGLGAINAASVELIAQPMGPGEVIPAAVDSTTADRCLLADAEFAAIEETGSKRVN